KLRRLHRPDPGGAADRPKRAGGRSKGRFEAPRAPLREPRDGRADARAVPPPPRIDRAVERLRRVEALDVHRRLRRDRLARARAAAALRARGPALRRLRLAGAALVRRVAGLAGPDPPLARAARRAGLA